MVFHWHIKETHHTLIYYKLIAMKNVKTFCPDYYSNLLTIERMLFILLSHLQNSI